MSLPATHRGGAAPSSAPADSPARGAGGASQSFRNYSQLAGALRERGVRGITGAGLAKQFGGRMIHKGSKFNVATLARSMLAPSASADSRPWQYSGGSGATGLGRAGSFTRWQAKKRAPAKQIAKAPVAPGFAKNTMPPRQQQMRSSAIQGMASGLSKGFRVSAEQGKALAGSPFAASFAKPRGTPARPTVIAKPTPAPIARAHKVRGGPPWG